MLAVVLTRLSQARQRSERANRLKNDSLARISHELRTPLNAIIGLSDLARRYPRGPNTPSYLSDIHKAGGSLLKLVNEILDFSRLESGKFHLTVSPYRVGRLFSDVLSLVSVRLRDKPRLAFHADISEKIPAVLLGDEPSIKQVLLNLLVNAVKYTHKGHIKFTAGFNKIDESLVELAFIVEDTGVGIRDEDIEHLFDDFVRLDRRVNRQVEGTGLGLSIALSLCRMMNGDIAVESVFGKGSKFTATCRQAIIDPRPMGKLPDRLPDGAIEENLPFLAPSLRVLVVDDVQTNLTVAKGLLEPFMMEVSSSLSGQEAIGLAKGTPFDLVFIDQMMPGLDGVETLKQIRAISGHYLRSPIISLTANAVTGARESLLDQGFDDYISKPIDVEELTSLLEKWVPAKARVPVPKKRLVAPGDSPMAGPMAGPMERPVSATENPLLGTLGFPANAPPNSLSQEAPALAPVEPDVQDGQEHSQPDGFIKADFLEVLETEGFDPRDGLRRSGNSQPKYREILGAFLLDVEAFKGYLVTPGKAEELAALAIRVHALKSATANIGANRLSHKAASLEEAANSGDLLAFANGGLDIFKDELAKVSERVSQALRRPQANAAPTGKKPSATTLDSLKKALEGHDVSLADRLIEELSSECDQETKIILAAASDQILVADYLAARNLLDRI
jgi:CheY-like chemotaxis protein/HPt (histidine-containing phosphotransfer) domain-containing protein